MEENPAGRLPALRRRSLGSNRQAADTPRWSPPWRCPGTHGSAWSVSDPRLCCV